jgi:hypothetical protein
MRSQADELLSAGPIAEFIFGDAGERRQVYQPADRSPIFQMGAAS